VQVEKPASLTAGPDSPAVPGRFPLRQTLSGFCRTCGVTPCGGLWQEAQVVVTGPRRLTDLHVQGTANGSVQISGECSAPGPVELQIFDPTGERLVREIVEAGPGLEWRGGLADPRPWSPANPALYHAMLSPQENGRGMPAPPRGILACGPWRRTAQSSC